MMFLVVRWEVIVELSLLVIVVAAIIAVGTIFLIRNLRLSFKDVFRTQSKFDIELRKAGNLISKVVKNNAFEKYGALIIKEMPFEEKKNLLDLIDESYSKIDLTDSNNKYITETYENLQEIRRTLDSKVLSFNHKISLFPFNIYAKLLKMKRMNHYTHQ
jgi:transcriptional/translational regulatory protein YebC/TACO1